MPARQHAGDQGHQPGVGGRGLDYQSLHAWPRRAPGVRARRPDPSEPLQWGRGAAQVRIAARRIQSQGAAAHHSAVLDVREVIGVVDWGGVGGTTTAKDQTPAWDKRQPYLEEAVQASAGHDQSVGSHPGPALSSRRFAHHGGAGPDLNGFSERRLDRPACQCERGETGDLFRPAAGRAGSVE